MDKNDLIRAIAAAEAKRRELMVEWRTFVGRIVDEKRGLTADEQGKSDAYRAQADLLQIDVENSTQQLRALEAEENRLAQEAENARRQSFDAGRGNAPAPAANPYDTDEYRAEFRSFLQGRRSARDVAEFVVRTFPERRNLGRDGATEGAPVVPRNHLNRLVELLENASPFIREIRTQMVDGDKIFAVETGKGTAAYRNPGDAYGGTDPALASKNVTICDLGRVVTVDEELLDDAAIPLEDYLMRNFATVFADTMESQIINGDDAKGPLGTDGIIALTGLGAKTTAAVGVVDFDDIIDLRAQVAVAGRNGAKWVFSPATEAALLKLKDGNDRPLWTPSYREGEPGLVLGQPYLLSDAMPDIGLGNVAVLYGAFAAHVTNYVRTGMTMRRLVELYAANGRVGFRGSFRHDVVVDLPSALARLTVKAA